MLYPQQQARRKVGKVVVVALALGHSFQHRRGAWGPLLSTVEQLYAAGRRRGLGRSFCAGSETESATQAATSREPSGQLRLAA